MKLRLASLQIVNRLKSARKFACIKSLHEVHALDKRTTKEFNRLVPNSTTRTPATDMLYNTINGKAHNNSTTCCTTNLPHRNARAQHLDMSKCWDVATFCPLVVNLHFVVLQVVELL